MVDQQQANPFFRTENGGYGTKWASHESGQNPVKAENTPMYRETGERQLALKNSQRTYKHEVLKEMRENGELDTQIYGAIKANQNAIKRIEVTAKEFPAKLDEIKYPEQALKVGNPLFMTSNMSYGTKPGQADMPTKYYPRPPQFTSTFLGGQFADTGLNTNKNPSRVHGSHDC